MKATMLELIILLSLGLLVLSLRAEAQPTGKAIRIGVLHPGVPPAATEPPYPLLDLLRSVLQEQAWVEHQNLTIELRWAAGQYERLPALAAELVQLPVDVLIASTTVAAQAAQHATQTIPIVFVQVADPVGKGLVASLARPGANVTGVTYVPTLEVNQKRVQLFMEAVPQMSRMAVLWNPTNPTPALPLVEQAARALGVPLHLLAVRDLPELDQAFHAITNEHDNGLFFMGDPFLFTQRKRIAQFALEHRLPTMFPESPYVEAGGLMSYGLFIPEMFGRAAALVVKILQGATPADLPVELPMKLELVVNLKTAQALGLTLPATVLFQADKVIK